MIFVDSSALFKLVKFEPESSAFSSFVGDTDLVGSELLLTEVRRAAITQSALEPHPNDDELFSRAEWICSQVSLVPVDAEVLIAAGGLRPASLRSLDAIHLASALISEADVFISYDRRQAEAAREAGLNVVTPGN